jgi:HEAT repeat protein
MPSELISRALSACSVDCFDIGPGIPFDSDAFALGDVGIDFTGEITELDPVAFLEELPETTGDPVFLGILDRVKRTDGEERAEAVRSLGDFRVKQSVNALSQLAADQNEPVLRAAAITALGEIDHTSVFVPIIIALVEDAREVRAAAARALSGLSIDRADAYALVVQQSDPDTRHAVALACIKSGIARQAIERLSSVDKRQAYEAFATLAVLASSNEIATILDAMGQSDETLAIAATRVLGAAGLPDSLPALRQMAVRDAISENVRTAISEVIHKIDQNQPV